MKRVLSLLAFVCIAISAFADGETPEQQQQSTKSASLFSAVSANYSLLTWKTKANGQSNSEDMNGFTFGWLMNLPITNHCVTVFGIQYQFGIEIEKVASIEMTAIDHDVKLPLKFGYSTDFGTASQVSLYAGPSFLFCVSQTNELDYGSYTNKYDYISGKYEVTKRGTVNKGQSDSYKKMNIFDLQLGLGVMYRYKGFGLRLEYDWGVLNRYKKSSSTKSYASQLTAGIFWAFY